MLDQITIDGMVVETELPWSDFMSDLEKSRKFHRDAEDAMNESLKRRALARLSSSMGADPDGDLIRELYVE